MSSKPIYPHVPYFYIIDHIASGKRYAGCRYAKGCNPVEFMTEGGYCTSSSTVSRIVKEEGLDAFVVVEIKTMDEVGDVYEYETKFLTENDCASSDVWLNAHNNAGMTFGTKEFKEKSKQTCLKNHGVEHPMQSEKIQKQKRQTCLELYGTEHAIQSEVVKEKSRNTNLKRRGVEYSAQCAIVREKSRNTNLKRRGVEYSVQSEVVKEKSRQTNLKNRGVENSMQSAEVREKSRQTNLKRRGVEYASQCDEFKEAMRQNLLNNHGVENVFQLEEVKEKSKQTCLKNHGVDNYSKTDEFKEFLSNLNNERLDVKINNEIINGNFGRFIYLYDTLEHVFLMGVETCLNRHLEQKRFVKINANKGFKKYIDVLTGTGYYIDASKFSVPLPKNFIYAKQ